MALKTEWQWHYLERDHIEAASNAGTLRVKLPVREQISAIEVEIRAIRHVTGYIFTTPIYSLPEKIEVIGDGAKVLYSMVPETAMFVHFFTMKSVPYLELSMTGYSWNVFRVKIPFGRHLRDEEWMLDTSVYNNVYLEIPWALPIASWTTFTFQYTIRYLRPIQKLSPKGFIRSRDIEYGAHVWAAAGHYYVDLPLKYPWRVLGCRIWDPDQKVENDITHIKLDIDDGRLVLVDDDLDDLVLIDTERLPYPIHVHYMHNHLAAVTTNRVYTCLGYPQELSGMLMGGTQGSLFHEGFFGQQVAYWVYDHLGAAVDSRANLTIHGAMYFCNVMIKDWFGGDPFPVSEHSEAQIDYSHGAFTVDDLRTWIQEYCPMSI